MSILDSADYADPVLEERYGNRPRWSRLIAVVVVALLVTAGVAWVIWAGLAASNPPVSAQLRAYEVRSPHETDVTLRIDRRDGDAVQCQVYAVDQDQAVVGERTIVIPAGEPGRVEPDPTARITTERRAIAADLGSCEVTDGPS